MALKLKFWWNFLITLNLAFWGNHANFWNYTFFQYQSTMLGFLCTVFPFGRKRNKPMCYIITLLPTEEMYKISIKYYYIWPQKRIQILLLNFFSLRTFYLYLYCKAVCLSVVVKVIPFFFHCRFVVYPEVKNRGSHLLSYLHTYPIFSFWTNLQII